MTEQVERLIERLRAMKDDPPPGFKYVPHEAADLIKSLSSQLAEARGALEEIANLNQVRAWTATRDNPKTHWEVFDGPFAKIARAALPAEQGEE